MIEGVIILALLSLLIATDAEPGGSVLLHEPPRRPFTGKARADRTKN